MRSWAVWCLLSSVIGVRETSGRWDNPHKGDISVTEKLCPEMWEVTSLLKSQPALNEYRLKWNFFFFFFFTFVGNEIFRQLSHKSTRKEKAQLLSRWSLNNAWVDLIQLPKIRGSWAMRLLLQLCISLFSSIYMILQFNSLAGLAYEKRGGVWGV